MGFDPMPDEPHKKAWCGWLYPISAMDIGKVLDAVDEVAKNYDTTAKYAKKPALASLKKAFAKMKVRVQERSELVGCMNCDRTGVIAVVMLMDVDDNVMHCAPRETTIPAPTGTVSMQPCSCDMGKRQNEMPVWRYTDKQLQLLSLRYGQKSSTRAWAIVVECQRAWAEGHRDQTALRKYRMESRFDDTVRAAEMAYNNPF